VTPQQARRARAGAEVEKGMRSTRRSCRITVQDSAAGYPGGENSPGPWGCPPELGVDAPSNPVQGSSSRLGLRVMNCWSRIAQSPFNDTKSQEFLWPFVSLAP